MIWLKSWSHTIYVSINLCIYVSHFQRNKKQTIDLCFYYCNFLWKLSIFLSIYLYIYPSIHLYIYLSIYLSIYIYIYIFTYISIYLSMYLTIYPSIHLSIYPSNYLSIFLLFNKVFFNISYRDQRPRRFFFQSQWSNKNINNIII